MENGKCVYYTVGVWFCFFLFDYSYCHNKGHCRFGGVDFLLETKFGCTWQAKLGNKKNLINLSRIMRQSDQSYYCNC